MPAPPSFMKLKVDHKTVLCRDLNAYRALRDFLLNSGYSLVYETERVDWPLRPCDVSCHETVFAHRHNTFAAGGSSRNRDRGNRHPREFHPECMTHSGDRSP